MDQSGPKIYTHAPRPAHEADERFGDGPYRCAILYYGKHAGVLFVVLVGTLPDGSRRFAYGLPGKRLTRPSLFEPASPEIEAAVRAYGFRDRFSGK